MLSEVQELPFWQSLGEVIDYLLICQNVEESHNSFVHHVTNVMIFELDMLGIFMKYMIL